MALYTDFLGFSKVLEERQTQGHTRPPVPLRNKVLEFIDSKGSVTHRQLKNWFSRLSEDTQEIPDWGWIRQSSHLIDKDITESGVVNYTLTKRGKGVLETARKYAAARSVNEEQFLTEAEANAAIEIENTVSQLAKDSKLNDRDEIQKILQPHAGDGKLVSLIFRALNKELDELEEGTYKNEVTGVVREMDPNVEADQTEDTWKEQIKENAELVEFLLEAENWKPSDNNSKKLFQETGILYCNKSNGSVAYKGRPEPCFIDTTLKYNGRYIYYSGGMEGGTFTRKNGPSNERLLVVGRTAWKTFGDLVQKITAAVLKYRDRTVVKNGKEWEIIPHDKSKYDELKKSITNSIDGLTFESYDTIFQSFTELNESSTVNEGRSSFIRGSNIIKGTDIDINEDGNVFTSSSFPGTIEIWNDDRDIFEDEKEQLLEFMNRAIDIYNRPNVTYKDSVRIRREASKFDYFCMEGGFDSSIFEDNEYITPRSIVAYFIAKVAVC